VKKFVFAVLIPLFLSATDQDAIFIQGGSILERNYSLSGGITDTLGYPASYGGQFIMSPGDAMLMVYQMPYDGVLKGVNIPIYKWGTGDQQLTISIHRLTYPNGADGTPYSLETVDRDGWIGGYDMDTNGWVTISGTNYTDPGTEGICKPSTQVASNAADPLLASSIGYGPPDAVSQGLIWPDGFTAAILNPTNFGDFASDGEVDHWINLADFGTEPELSTGDWVGILVAFTGEGGGDEESTGFFYTEGRNLVDPWRFMKFYSECNGTSGNGGWHIRHWIIMWELAVEVTSDRGPIIRDITPLYSSADTTEKDVTTTITDDNPSGGNAGVAEAQIIYWVNPGYGEGDTVAMTLESGTVLEGIWRGTIPGQSPGTDVEWLIRALDINNIETKSLKYAYSVIGYQSKDCLVIDNSITTYGEWVMQPNMFGEWSPCDWWFLSSYGPVDLSLLQNYNKVIEFTAGGPVMSVKDTISKWWQQGNKRYILTGDEVLNSGSSGRLYSSGSFEYDVLGISRFTADINYSKSGDEEGVTRIIAVDGDMISGDLFVFLEDTLELNYDPNYELGLNNWIDGIIEYSDEIQVSIPFYAVTGILDTFGFPTGQDTMPTAVYHVGINGSKTAFFAFDPFALNTSPNYHWVGGSDLNPIVKAIRWMESDSSNLSPQIATVIDISEHRDTEETGPFLLLFRIQPIQGWELGNSPFWLYYNTDTVNDSLPLVTINYEDLLTYACWVPEFPGITGTTELRYYLTIYASDGTRMLWPPGAPEETARFLFGPDTVAPQILELRTLHNVHYQIPYEQRVNVTVTDDRFGTESILQWQVNNDSIYTLPMKAYDSTGIHYTTTLSGSTLMLGDTITYWVEAKDLSQNQNVAISEKKSFIAQNKLIIGNWDTYWEDYEAEGKIHSWDIWDHGELTTLEDKKLVLLPYDYEFSDTCLYLKPIDLRYVDVAGLIINMIYEFERKINFGYVEFSVDGLEWDILKTITGDSVNHEVRISLMDYIHRKDLRLRFRADKRGAGNFYWEMDDIILHSDSTLLTAIDGYIVPVEYTLHPNYPNPFNPVTTIRYELPVRSHVNLIVYDILGREVAVLVDGDQGPGARKVRWNATGIPSGIYFVRMVAGDFRQVRKVMILK